MMFVPQAICKTLVPDTFKVLLSQRRRWINSTIHNLVKLVFVNDLCGTFCFSMQFVIFFELCGTVVLPAALCFTCYICLAFIFSQSIEILPVILLFAILGLPGVLIFLTSCKWNYILWMLVYLFALPIWNFVLPLYAVWHMDDFSWGETRKISSTGNDTAGKKDKPNEKDITDDKERDQRVPFKLWSEYEIERIYDSQLHFNESYSYSPGTLSKSNIVGSPLLRNTSFSTLTSIGSSSIYSTLISNYNSNGGSHSKINYHDLYQRSQQNDLFLTKRNSEVLLDKLESAFGKYDIVDHKKSRNNYPERTVISPFELKNMYDNKSHGSNSPKNNSNHNNMNNKKRGDRFSIFSSVSASPSSSNNNSPKNSKFNSPKGSGSSSPLRPNSRSPFGSPKYLKNSSNSSSRNSPAQLNTIPLETNQKNTNTNTNTSPLEVTEFQDCDSSVSIFNTNTIVLDRDPTDPMDSTDTTDPTNPTGTTNTTDTTYTTNTTGKESSNTTEGDKDILSSPKGKAFIMSTPKIDSIKIQNTSDDKNDSKEKGSMNNNTNNSENRINNNSGGDPNVVNGTTDSDNTTSTDQDQNSEKSNNNNKGDHQRNAVTPSEEERRKVHSSNNSFTDRTN